MFPSKPKFDLSDYAMANPIQASERSWANGRRINRPNVRFGELGVSIALSASKISGAMKTRIPSVLNVLASCYPFEVVGAVVTFVSIFMIRLMSCWSRAVKCSTDQDMKSYQFLPTLFAFVGQMIGSITKFCDLRFQHIVNSLPPFLSSDSTKSRNLIVGKTRCCDPFFFIFHVGILAESVTFI